LLLLNNHSIEQNVSTLLRSGGASLQKPPWLVN
jgi:hypothetical protein